MAKKPFIWRIIREVSLQKVVNATELGFVPRADVADKVFKKWKKFCFTHWTCLIACESEWKAYSQQKRMNFQWGTNLLHKIGEPIKLNWLASSGHFYNWMPQKSWNLPESIRKCHGGLDIFFCIYINEIEELITKCRQTCEIKRFDSQMTALKLLNWSGPLCLSPWSSYNCSANVKFRRTKRWSLHGENPTLFDIFEFYRSLVSAVVCALNWQKHKKIFQLNHRWMTTYPTSLWTRKGKAIKKCIAVNLGFKNSPRSTFFFSW